MPLSPRPMVVLDDRAPEAAEQSAGFAAKIVGASPVAEIHLLVVLPPTPSQFLEFGSLEDMHAQGVAMAHHRGPHQEWLDATLQAVHPVIDRARETLRRSGVEIASIHEHCRTSVHARQLAKEAIEAAREFGCDVVIIGRDSRSKLRHWVHADPADELVRLGDGVTVCVVG